MSNIFQTNSSANSNTNPKTNFANSKLDLLFYQFLEQNGILELWENLKTDFENGKISPEFLIEKISKIIITAKIPKEIQDKIAKNSKDFAGQNSQENYYQNSDFKNPKSVIRQKIEKIAQINQKIDENSKNKTVIIGNGDIVSLMEAFEKASDFGLDGVMIGRGIFSNPWLFGGSTNLKLPKERVNLLIFHLNLWQKTWQNAKNYQSLKKYFKIYIQGFGGAAELRAKLMETDCIEKAIEISTNHLENC